MSVMFKQQDGSHDTMRSAMISRVSIATGSTTEHHFPVSRHQPGHDVMSQPLPLATVAWRRRQQTEKLDANGCIVVNGPTTTEMQTSCSHTHNAHTTFTSHFQDHLIN